MTIPISCETALLLSQTDLCHQAVYQYIYFLQRARTLFSLFRHGRFADIFKLLMFGTFQDSPKARFDGAIRLTIYGSP